MADENSIDSIITKFDKMGGVINGVENSKSVHSNTSNTSKRDTAAVIE